MVIMRLGYTAGTRDWSLRADSGWGHVCSGRDKLLSKKNTRGVGILRSDALEVALIDKSVGGARQVRGGVTHRSLQF